MSAETVAARIPPRRRKRMRESRGDRIFLVGVYAFLCFVAVVILLPLVYIVAASFSSSSAVINGSVYLWPVHPTLQGYLTIFHYPGVWQAYVNSVYYTVFGTALSVALSVMMAYPLSRPGFAGKRFFVFALLTAYLFTGGLIPFYLVVRSLGMLDTRMAMIIPTALSLFSVILAKTFFQTTVPNELVDAAYVDGAGDFTVLWRVVLPLSKPIIAVLALIFAVGVWNSYFYALVFLNSQDLYPLQLVLRQVLVLNELSTQQITTLPPQEIAHFQDLATLVKYSLIVIGSLPMLIMYPFAQKYFVKGIRIGSLKG